MSRVVALAAVIAALAGVVAGFLWWGLPTRRLETELRDARASADRLRDQVDEQISSRLHMLVSEGKK